MRHGVWRLCRSAGVDASLDLFRHLAPWGWWPGAPRHGDGKPFWMVDDVDGTPEVAPLGRLLPGGYTNLESPVPLVHGLHVTATGGCHAFQVDLDRFGHFSWSTWSMKEIWEVLEYSTICGRAGFGLDCWYWVPHHYPCNPHCHPFLGILVAMFTTVAYDRHVTISTISTLCGTRVESNRISSGAPWNITVDKPLGLIPIINPLVFPCYYWLWSPMKLVAQYWPNSTYNHGRQPWWVNPNHGGLRSI